MPKTKAPPLPLEERARKLLGERTLRGVLHGDRVVGPDGTVSLVSEPGFALSAAAAKGEYLVSLAARHCTCPAFAYRRDLQEGCKHLEFVDMILDVFVQAGLLRA